MCKLKSTKQLKIVDFHTNMIAIDSIVAIIIIVVTLTTGGCHTLDGIRILYQALQHNPCVNYLLKLKDAMKMQY